MLVIREGETPEGRITAIEDASGVDSVTRDTDPAGVAACFRAGPHNGE